MSSQAYVDAARAAGAAAAQAALHAAAVAQATADAATQTRIRAAAHRAVDAATQTTGGTLAAAMGAAVAAAQLADTLPSSDTSEAATAVRAQAETARAQASTAAVSRAQALYTALQGIAGDATSATSADAQGVVRDVHASMDAVQAAARALWGGSVGDGPHPRGPDVGDTVSQVRHTLAQAARLLMSPGFEIGSAMGNQLRGHLREAQQALDDIAGAAGAGLAFGGLMGLALLFGGLWVVMQMKK